MGGESYREITLSREGKKIGTGNGEDEGEYKGNALRSRRAHGMRQRITFQQKRYLKPHIAADEKTFSFAGSTKGSGFSSC